MGLRATCVVHTRPGHGIPTLVERQEKRYQVNGSDAVIFTETKLPGAYIIEPERLEDERGFFARTWCQQESPAHTGAPVPARACERGGMAQALRVIPEGVSNFLCTGKPPIDATVRGLDGGMMVSALCGCLAPLGRRYLYARSPTYRHTFRTPQTSGSR